MHGRREDVVRRLAHVDVVVRMHVLAGQARDHLVRVHVRARARPGLEDVDRELVVELAGRDAVSGGGDALRLVGVEQPELGVHPGGSRLDAAEPARDGTGMGSPETGKLATALAVSEPQSSRLRLARSHASSVVRLRLPARRPREAEHRSRGPAPTVSPNRDVAEQAFCSEVRPGDDGGAQPRDGQHDVTSVESAVISGCRAAAGGRGARRRGSSRTSRPSPSARRLPECRGTRRTGWPARAAASTPRRRRGVARGRTRPEASAARHVPPPGGRRAASGCGEADSARRGADACSTRALMRTVSGAPTVPPNLTLRPTRLPPWMRTSRADGGQLERAGQPERRSNRDRRRHRLGGNRRRPRRQAALEAPASAVEKRGEQRRATRSRERPARASRSGCGS